ncbi:MAG TPA: sulfotransferase [Rudaea sp.]|nr:sulfotransferase [Rudaea sp.]
MNSPMPSRMQTALAGLPPVAAKAVVAAEAALRFRRLDEAERQLTAAAALAPSHPEVLHLQANLLALRGRYVEAVTALQQAMVQRPRDPLILNSLGLVLRRTGRLDDATQAFRHALALDPKLVGAWFNLALVHAALSEFEQGIAALRNVLRLAPDHHNARTLLADLLKEEGSAEDAQALYREVLARHPLSGMAWLGLSNVKTKPLQPDDVRKIEAALADPRTGAHDRSAMRFALAKALEDQQRFPEAFAALQAANASVRERRAPWSREAMSAQVDAALSAFAASPAADSDFGQEAIFVVSMPRSGSTLTEQILASHPQVEGASELNDLWLVLAEETQRREKMFTEWAALATPEDWRRLGSRYLERTERWRRTRPRFTNKMPGNWLYIGAILQMLPGARIVVCLRDPLETCFACYRQMLEGNEYTHDFGDLVAYWRDFDRAVRHWHALDPRRVRLQVYEELVADPEQQTRALLEFCNLPFDPACLRFYETERRTRTPSATQVRQPIRRDTARTAKYGAALEPLRQALLRVGAAVPALPAATGEDPSPGR